MAAYLLLKLATARELTERTPPPLIQALRPSLSPSCNCSTANLPCLFRSLADQTGITTRFLKPDPFPACECNVQVVCIANLNTQRVACTTERRRAFRLEEEIVVQLAEHEFLCLSNREPMPTVAEDLSFFRRAPMTSRLNMCTVKYVCCSMCTQCEFAVLCGAASIFARLRSSCGPALLGSVVAQARMLPTGVMRNVIERAVLIERAFCTR